MDSPGRHANRGSLQFQLRHRVRNRPCARPWKESASVLQQGPGQKNIPYGKGQHASELQCCFLCKHRRSRGFHKEEFVAAVCEKVGQRYVGYVADVSGVNTQGAKLKETRENLKEALQLILKINKEIV